MNNEFLKNFISTRKNNKSYNKNKIKRKLSTGYEDKEITTRPSIKKSIDRNITKKNKNSKKSDFDFRKEHVQNFLISLQSREYMKDDNIPIIACVLRRSKDYDIDYVIQLIQSLKRNITVDVEYVCLSDVDVSNFCTHLKFEKNWSGWWSKLELFSHPYLKGKKVIYFDLDVVIQNNIDDFILYDHNFSMLKGFSKNGIVNSSIMAWAGDRSHISDSFVPDVHMNEYKQKHKWGDQDFTRLHVKDKIDLIQNTFPNLVSSKKHSDIDQIKSSSIVCFHGNPRPRQVNWKVL